jgi:hypothetical protein
MSPNPNLILSTNLRLGLPSGLFATSRLYAEVEASDRVTSLPAECLSERQQCLSCYYRGSNWKNPSKLQSAATCRELNVAFRVEA